MYFLLTSLLFVYYNQFFFWVREKIFEIPAETPDEIVLKKPGPLPQSLSAALSRATSLYPRSC